ncbi:MAG: OmcA/MtrC family decaheme c-type cytochrome [Steroidobacteraceae bacterium]
MSYANGTRPSPGARSHLAITIMLLSALIEACSGTTGSSGAPGAAGPPGPPGPTTPGSALNIGTATAITGKITSVTIGGPPAVKFQLTDQNGAFLQGLPATDVSFTIAQLVPGQNGSSSQWNSYIYRTVAPQTCPAGVPACATSPETQPTVESAATGTLVDNGDGTYQYTFKKDITTDPNVVYDAALTHRVGFEIRNLVQANNAAYTFQPSSGATSGIFSREIIDTATCDNCHTSLSAHGGARVETQYCVMCHNPGNTDPNSGNTLDMKVMIHKIHSGITLPSIQTATVPNTTPTLGIGYWIVGHADSLSNFNTVLYPQDTRNCATCHVQAHPLLAEAANFKSVPTMEACGACHDNVNFSSGANHGPGIVANDTQCTTCHGTTSTIDNGNLQVVAAHIIPEVVAAAKFQYVVNSVSFATDIAHNLYPVVKFSVIDPTNGNAPYNILSAAAFTGIDPGTGKPVCASGGTARLAIDIAWETSDYTNWGSGTTPTAWGQPFSLNPLAVAGCAAAVPPSAITGPDATGAFTLTSPSALPTPPVASCPPTSANACPAIGNLAIIIEGHPGIVTTGPGTTPIAVKSVVSYANTTGAAPISRRTVVDIAKCDVCHSVLTEHGDNRNDNPQVCVACHNPASTDGGMRQTLTTPGIDGLWEESIDFKHMIHAIHDGSVRGAAGSPFVVYGFGGSVNDFSDVVFPGQLNRCDLCHTGTSYYPVDDSAVQASTFLTGLSKESPNPTTAGNPIATSANMSVCSACHVDAVALAHMQQNGGSAAVAKDAEGRTILSANPANVETCSLCHGPGGVADVKVVHQIPTTAN